MKTLRYEVVRTFGTKYDEVKCIGYVSEYPPLASGMYAVCCMLYALLKVRVFLRGTLWFVVCGLWYEVICAYINFKCVTNPPLSLSPSVACIR